MSLGATSQPTAAAQSADTPTLGLAGAPEPSVGGAGASARDISVQRSYTNVGGEVNNGTNIAITTGCGGGSWSPGTGPPYAYLMFYDHCVTATFHALSMSIVTDPATIAKIQPPLLGNFGAADKGIPADDVKKFAEKA